jgi:hypothetical protein
VTVAAILIGPVAQAQERRTLRDSLAALEQAHDLTIFTHPAVRLGVRGPQAVDLNAAETALRTLLHGYDIFLQYTSGTRNDAGRLQRVWVFPRGAAASLRIVNEDEIATDGPERDLGSQLRDALAESPEAAVAVVTRAIEDADDNVRQQALEAVVQEALPVPRYVLESAFMGDRSEAVRVAAFDALVAQAAVEGADVTATIDVALQDPSPLLRERAQAVLESLPKPEGSD